VNANKTVGALVAGLALCFAGYSLPRVAAQYVLSLLKSEGPDAVRRFLENQLANEAQDQKVLHAKPAGFRDASFSYKP